MGSSTVDDKERYPRALEKRDQCCLTVTGSTGAATTDRRGGKMGRRDTRAVGSER